MNDRLQQFAESFVASTREHIFIRPEDRLLILRPNKVYHLNATAVELLSALYGAQHVDVAALARDFAARYQTTSEQIEHDLEALLDSVRWLLKGQPGYGAAVRRTPFGTHPIKYPVLSEIALTYRCNNRCTFCYASAPERGPEVREMTTDEVKRVIDKIVDQAKVPTVSFTGGEPTLRRDLPELIAYAKSRQMRVNLITNGTRCAQADFVARLKQAGLTRAAWKPPNEIQSGVGSARADNSRSRILGRWHPPPTRRSISIMSITSTRYRFCGRARPGVSIDEHGDPHGRCGGSTGGRIDTILGRWCCRSQHAKRAVALRLVFACPILPVQSRAAWAWLTVLCRRRRPAFDQSSRRCAPVLELRARPGKSVAR
jgi:hypothetical protein